MRFVQDRTCAQPYDRCCWAFRPPLPIAHNNVAGTQKKTDAAPATKAAWMGEFDTYDVRR
jgi:hypothetical protein